MREHTRYQEQELQLRKTLSRGISDNAMGWLLAGIAIGAGAALLLAPSSGRELRNAIAGGCRRTLEGIRGGISRGTRQLRQRGSNLLSFNRYRAKG
ncbi:MAG TPA: YtxH domain-containing protein [Candidatus Angelobacter sp.]|jgi:gas vesicle protein